VPDYDFFCLNKYYGWYVGHGNIDATLKGLSDKLDEFHSAFGKPMILNSAIPWRRSGGPGTQHLRFVPGRGRACFASAPSALPARLKLGKGLSIFLRRRREGLIGECR
jgi:hypothetical protein